MSQNLTFQTKMEALRPPLSSYFEEIVKFINLDNWNTKLVGF